MAKTSRIVNVTIGARNMKVGTLRFESDGRRQSSAFEYDPAWLSFEGGFDISPSLPRQPGPFFSSGTRDNPRAALPGVISDATPDSWGRSLMRSALGNGLTEFDYLTLSDDRTRQGALRYLDEDGRQMADPDRPLARRTLPLERLRALALAYDRDPARAEAEATELTGAVGSLGGARPKANVIAEDGLFIAKFTSERDGKPIEQIEVATLNLARDAGLRASAAQLALGNTRHPVALIRRFDRRGDRRIPYMSARTALGGAESGTYDEMAEVIRRISKDPRADLEELFGRIAFTILVANTDDHLKNHGFLYLGDNRWGLAPAFDINPQPDRQRSLETPISELSGHDASIEALIEAAPFFDLGETDGIRIAGRIGAVIRDHWRGRLEEQKVSGAQARLYEPAFLNPEMKLLEKIVEGRFRKAEAPPRSDQSPGGPGMP
ncbi:serine/threonine-protein kinase HipA [Rhodovulum bhavnagarense]|uniref:Serine/threonine-protein kinase HipA n=1 Tax=Rhodovulum bhavnagarense TaxID=992286 RepID=A0A4R2RDB0_9RHOB|nr:type II toxin-antitoxin system HipA family toxin [Rhodovulum bhavnagarense]TCP61422.1 serine/threonine-protein kinase HipA [Rhodovulum bhavnagarense]